jgi:hypothetical protein
MKTNFFTYSIIVVAIASAFSQPVEKTSITGKIKPVNAAEVVWAISGKDTVRATIISGAFTVEIAPGTYKLVVEGKTPYKNVEMLNLEVRQNQALDVGEILLQAN